jgi:hypothetical protein
MTTFRLRFVILGGIVAVLIGVMSLSVVATDIPLGGDTDWDSGKGKQDNTKICGGWAGPCITTICATESKACDVGGKLRNVVAVKALTGGQRPTGICVDPPSSAGPTNPLCYDPGDYICGFGLRYIELVITQPPEFTPPGPSLPSPPPPPVVSCRGLVCGFSVPLNPAFPGAKHCDPEYPIGGRPAPPKIPQQ